MEAKQGRQISDSKFQPRTAAYRIAFLSIDMGPGILNTVVVALVVMGFRLILFLKRWDIN